MLYFNLLLIKCITLPFLQNWHVFECWFNCILKLANLNIGIFVNTNVVPKSHKDVCCIVCGRL